MDGYGIFDELSSSEAERRTAAKSGQLALDSAKFAAAEQFGQLLAQATDKDDFDDRVAMVRQDIVKTVAAYLIPRPAVMRQVIGSMKPDFGKRRADYGSTVENPTPAVPEEDPAESTEDLREKVETQPKDASRRVAQEDPVEHDPALSGTDAQEVAGDDFESLDPDRVETQPKDASVKTALTGDLIGWWNKDTKNVWVENPNSNSSDRTVARLAPAETESDAYERFGAAGFVRYDNLLPAGGSYWTCSLALSVHASRKQAEHPAHLPDTFDGEESGETELFVSPEDTSPREAATSMDDASPQLRADVDFIHRHSYDWAVDSGLASYLAESYASWMARRTMADEQIPEYSHTSMYETFVQEELGGNDPRFASHSVTAGFSETNWRSYSPGNGPELHADYDEYDVEADYYDALYPESNPHAVYAHDEVFVFNGQGELVERKDAYSESEAKAIANKLLQKLYKGEAVIPKGQGKFFTTPGQGKLFAQVTAGAEEDYNSYVTWAFANDADSNNPNTLRAYADEKGLTGEEEAAIEAFGVGSPVPTASDFGIQQVASNGWDNDGDTYTRSIGSLNAVVAQWLDPRVGEFYWKWTVTSAVGEWLADGFNVDPKQAMSEAESEMSFMRTSGRKATAAVRVAQGVARGMSAVAERRRRTAATTAMIHRVAGWDWDDRMAGYIAESGVDKFACDCGEHFSAPAHVSCKCGRIWNAYTINGSKLVCREVPRRQDVLLANRA